MSSTPVGSSAGSSAVAVVARRAGPARDSLPVYLLKSAIGGVLLLAGGGGGYGRSGAGIAPGVARRQRRGAVGVHLVGGHRPGLAHRYTDPAVGQDYQDMGGGCRWA